MSGPGGTVSAAASRGLASGGRLCRSRICTRMIQPINFVLRTVAPDCFERGNDDSFRAYHLKNSSAVRPAQGADDAKWALT